MALGLWLTLSAASPGLCVDQVGYPAKGVKRAVVKAQVQTEPAANFRVLRADDGRQVLQGMLGALRSDPDSGDGLRTADFSALREAGRYVLEVPGQGRSWAFEVAERPYGSALSLALAGLHGQRCGAAVDLGPAHPGYRHGACHLVARFHPSSGTTGGSAPSVHGWHDAGDYGRYVVSSSFAAAALLSATELYGLPGPAQEARWGVDWLLSMQDGDGGVWHKETSAEFAGFVLPEADAQPVEIIGTGAAPFKGTCATADVAAIGAIAARVYAADAPYAARALRVARAAWDWTQQHPDVTFRNPPGIHTGTYADAHCEDEQLWAAAELARTTHEARYRAYFVAHLDALMQAHGREAPSLSQLTPLALWTWALADGQRSADIRALTQAVARAAARRTVTSGYGVSLRPADYVWGSNTIVAAQGWQLLMAFHWTHERTFADAALENLHYLLGRNSFSLSWVTGLGEHPYRHPHHRPSEADDQSEPWPGLLSGGPNAAREDPVMQARLPTGTPSARMYVDDPGAYAANEPSVDGNGALIFLLTGVQDL